MLDGYHRLFNRQALQTVIREVEIPDIELGIGAAEMLGPVPLIVDYTPRNRVPQFEKIKTADDMMEMGNGRQFQLSDFPMSGYMGEAL